MISKYIYLFIGTTAEYIKLAPVIKELNKRGISYKIITSGQQKVKFVDLEYFVGKINVYYAFKQRAIIIPLPLIFGFIIWTIKALYNYFLFFRIELKGRTKQNTYFIVHGDTVSALLGALVARFFHVTLVHIESGLRSFNFLEPFPEEICRNIVSELADIHFCPNRWCENNLKCAKGIKIDTGQNTLIETFWSTVGRKKNNSSIDHITRNKKYFMLVVHRQEHVIFNKNNMKQVLQIVLSSIPSNMLCVFIIHDMSVPFIYELKKYTGKKYLRNVVFIKKLPYIDFMYLLQGSEFVVTDGGSNQEELYYMGKPCLLLRNYSERIEGMNKNVVLSKNNRNKITNFFKQYQTFVHQPVKIDKRPSKIIVDYLLVN